ncbi:sialidase family protein [Streptomyces erythrochromogenes]|uniref:sialidase family protein n=1 Tax=Streptomyces erythrochromogenes TaxID=285574 RepID=UPI00381C6D72
MPLDDAGEEQRRSAHQGRRPRRRRTPGGVITSSHPRPTTTTVRTEIDFTRSTRSTRSALLAATSRDGGRTWSKARPFVDTAALPHTQTIGHVIVVDPRTGTLYDSSTGSPAPTT